MMLKKFKNFQNYENLIVSLFAMLGVFLGFVRTKIFALYLGPELMGLLGLFQNQTQLFGLFCNWGYGTTVTQKENDPVNQLSFALIALAIAFLGLSLIFYVVEIEFSLHGVSYSVIILSSILWSISLTAYGLCLRYNNGISLQKLQLLSNLTSLIFAFAIVTAFYNQSLILLGIVISSILVSICFYTSAIRTSCLVQLFVKAKFSNFKFKNFLLSIRSNFVLVVSGSTTLITLLLTRTVLLDTMGQESLGAFQGVVILFAAGSGIIYAPITTTYFKKCQEEPKSIRQSTLSQFKYQSIFIIPMVFLSLVFASYYHLILSNEFDISLHLVLIICFAEIARMYSTILSYEKISQKQFDKLLKVDLISLMVIFVSSYIVYYFVDIAPYLLLLIFQASHLFLNFVTRSNV